MLSLKGEEKGEGENHQRFFTTPTAVGVVFLSGLWYDGDIKIKE
ncbi:MAG: hypothetical protein AAB929_00230 [Patescibacteria group bacterium]